MTAHLHIVASNDHIVSPHRTSSERSARRASLGIEDRSAGCPQLPAAGTTSQAAPPVEESVYDSLPCDVEP